MARLVFSRDDILADPPFARRQEEAGYRLHGGFDAAGTYVPPRSLHRVAAIKAWSNQLQARGFPLIDASTKLLKRGNYPSAEQQVLLLSNGVGQSLWNGLTITGIIEARGRALCDVTAPDFQDLIVEDLAQTACGHLNKGLLHAHGLDEGGNTEGGEGGHDAMWFAVRDLLFGKNAYPLPVVPESLSRPEGGRRMPQIPAPFEGWILLLMNVLMIEVRAESYFNFCTTVMRDPRVFQDRRAAALHAADLVDRIRADEALHVGYLQAFVSELRSMTFKTVSGGTMPGADLIDPVWEGMVTWHAETNADFSAEQTRTAIMALLNDRPDGGRLRDQFLSLERKAAAE